MSLGRLCKTLKYMETFIQRIVDEKAELDERAGKLGDFVKSEKFHSLDSEIQSLMVGQYVGNGMFEYGQQAMINMFIRGAIWQEDQAIEILSSVLENWVHGGDADCIIAEFEEKLNNL